MLHNTSKMVSIYLILLIVISENVLFQTLCADIESENRYSTDDYKTNENNKINNKDDTTIIMPTLSPQQEADLKTFSGKLEQELLLDQKSNFPNAKNITLPSNEFEPEDLFRIITKLNNTNNGSGTYYSSFDTGNYGGAQTGEQKKEKLQVIKGHYTEKFKQDLPGGLPPIDVIRNVGYIADEKGYQPFIINYTIDDHRSDTELYYDVPFDDERRLSKEYKTHYKPQEQFSNVKLSKITQTPLVKDKSENYNFGFYTNTYARAESSETINKNTENETRIVKGQYSSLVGNDGFPVRQTIGYTADENGFQPFIIGFEKGTRFTISENTHYDSKRLAEDVSIHFKPLDEYKNVKLPTLDKQDQNKTSDKYQYSFSSDTYNRSEISEIKNKGTENEILVTKGQYTEKIKNEYDENVVRQIGYVADENGYQPFIIKSYIENKVFFVHTGVASPQAISPPPGSPRGQGIGSSYIKNALSHLG